MKNKKTKLYSVGLLTAIFAAASFSGPSFQREDLTKKIDLSANQKTILENAMSKAAQSRTSADVLREKIFDNLNLKTDTPETKTPEPKPAPAPKPAPEPKPEPEEKPKPSTPTQPEVPSSGLSAEGIVYWTNYYRKQNGKSELKRNAKLDKAAQARVKDMFDRQYFSHTTPSGETFSAAIRAAGYSYYGVGENIAYGSYKDDKTLVTAWYNSDGHRHNMLNSKYTEMGAAAGYGMFKGKNRWVAVELFGQPK
ncbi:CAP domain-containing protein [Candidatus Parcubacteria bacterium]|nr:MAG: CAP domain-containing protein [Candidatus Parcubacteria bacterium]